MYQVHVTETCSTEVYNIISSLQCIVLGIISQLSTGSIMPNLELQHMASKLGMADLDQLFTGY